jgi:hypothetical protein
VPIAKVDNVNRQMTQMAEEGWELVNASMHKTEAVVGQHKVMADQCTMFWRKPTEHTGQRGPV